MTTHKPRSLIEYFSAPQGYIGQFGWLCGYSADAGFLEEAAGHFTLRGPMRRGNDGDIALAVILDPGSDQILPGEVPGLLHLGKIGKPQPFRLLHAKVALLGYRHLADASHWRLRLIVSTGNWTRATVEESLDLVWSIDVDREDIQAGGSAVKQACADIKASWNMLSWLHQHFDTSIFAQLPQGRSNSLPTHGPRLLETWIAQASAFAGKATPRFFDNRTSSLQVQLPAFIHREAGNGARNYLALGSGFYEGTSGTDTIPSVLDDVVGRLKKNGLLTANCGIDVFVNPLACQAVASSRSALLDAGWNIRPAGQPEYFGNALRSLHAKFIFSANSRSNSNYCNNAWIYLGSGNLTSPGFGQKMSSAGGNLEAGVVFAPYDLLWESHKGEDSHHVVTNVLPLQWEHAFDADGDQLAVGSGMPDRSANFLAAPVPAFLWVVEAAQGMLIPVGDTKTEFAVVMDGGIPCAKDDQNRFLWTGDAPREVSVQWQEDGAQCHCTVPVIDEFGRVAGTTLPALDVDDVWLQLAQFPLPPEEDDPQDPNEPSGGKKKRSHTGADVQEADYPIRKMMQLIENVAAKQTALPESEWTYWCAKLEQALIQAGSSSVVEHFRRLELNPLSPLWQPPFRPVYAENAETEAGRHYETLLEKIAAHWQVAHLAAIGAST